MRSCGVCSASVPEGEATCPNCGFSVPDAVPAPAPAPAPPAATLPPDVDKHPTAVSARKPKAFGPGSTIAGKYVVLEHIGSGGMGQVWKARHVGLDALVCVKVLRRDFAADAGMVARFEQEAKSASRLRHPNSIVMNDFGRLDDGGFYIVMEFVQGRDLQTVLSTEWPLGEARTCRIVSQVLAALSAAHRAGVVHRDLKPENVMLEKIGDDPDFVKVLDFGIAKILGPTSSAPGDEPVVGTPAYMSPEQAVGLPVDHRADLYSVGVLLYRMIAGRLPFEGKSVADYLRAHAGEIPIAPRRRGPYINCSRQLEALIMRALHKDPDQRPQTADDFRRELQAIEAQTSSPKLPRAFEELTLDTQTPKPPAPPPPAPPPARLTAPLELDTSRLPPKVDPLEQARLDREVARARFRRKHGGKVKALVALVILGAAGVGAWVATDGKIVEIVKREGPALYAELLAKLDPPPPPPPVAPAPEPVPAPEPAPAEPAPTAVVVTKTPATRAIAVAPAHPKVVVVKKEAVVAAASDPRCPPGMVFVGGGMFPFGEKRGNTSVLVTVKEFCVDRFEFPNEPGEPPQLVGGPGDAVSTCAQHGKRLCGEEEWEHACKGPDDLAFPYGRSFEPDACNTLDGAGQPREVTASGMFARCLSGYGVADMVGNAAEWTSAARESGAQARRKGGTVSEVGGCGRVTGTANDVPAGFRCCADPL